MANGAVLEPSGDFPAWLEAQGVNAEVARAMDSELGIRDYGVLRACVGDGLVRAELLATARDRLPFGFYAVLRQVVKALQGADTQHAGTTTRWDDAASVNAADFGDATLGCLVDVLLMLLNGLNRELLQCMQRLGDMDILKYAPGSPSSASVASSDGSADETRRRRRRRRGDTDAAEYGNPENLSESSVQDATKHDPSQPYDETREAPSPRGSDECGSSHRVCSIKTEEDCAEHPGLTPENAGAGELAEWEEPASVPEAEPPGQSVLASPPGFIADGAGSSQPAGVDLSRGATADPGAFPWLQQTAGDQTAAQESSVAAAAYASPSPPPPPQAHAFRPGRPPPAHRPQRLSIGESGLYEHKPCATRPGSGKTDASRRLAPAAAAAGRDKPYRCKVCGCSFTQYSTLKRHLHKHNGERPYCCSACGRGFSQLPELRAHEDTHRREKPHRCRVCGQAFARSCHLTRHQRMHTGEKPYRCGACGHAFAQSCDLKTHERTHTGEKPYRCEACGRGFAQGAHLKRHQRTHSSRKPYRCRPCGRTFGDFGSFNAHQLTHMQNVAANRTAAAAAVAAAVAEGMADGNGVP